MLLLLLFPPLILVNSAHVVFLSIMEASFPTYFPPVLGKPSLLHLCWTTHRQRGNSLQGYSSEMKFTYESWHLNCRACLILHLSLMLCVISPHPLTLQIQLFPKSKQPMATPHINCHQIVFLASVLKIKLLWCLHQKLLQGMYSLSVLCM